MAVILGVIFHFIGGFALPGEKFQGQKIY